MQSRQSKNAICICKICFKDIKRNSWNLFLRENLCVCDDCFQKFECVDGEFLLNGVRGYYLFEYNDFIKELIYKYKGCADYELNSVFLNNRLLYAKLIFHNYVMIPAPSSKKDDEERGFNHVQEIFKNLGLKMVPCIKKSLDFKQSDLTIKERKKVLKKLEIHNGNILTGKNILLVDDVCTTGSTLSAMVDLVRKYNPKNIKIMVICRPKFTPNN